MFDFITWTANPELFSGFVSVRWYGLMFAIGFWVGFEIVWRIFRHEGAPESWVQKLLIYVVIATIIGSRLGHVFFYDWAYYKDHLLEIFKIWEGGLASHGGTLGIIVAIFIYSHNVTKRSALWTFDRLVVPVAFVGALIRLGNLMNHEIFGSTTSLPWGFRFVVNLHSWMNGAEPIFTAPSHPTQLYEALCYLVLFGICMWLYWKRNAQRRPGLIFGVFLFVLFASRFVVEYVKNVQEPWEIGLRQACGMDMGQLLSIPFIIIGIVLAIRALLRPAVDIAFPNKFPPEKK